MTQRLTTVKAENTALKTHLGTRPEVNTHTSIQMKFKSFSGDNALNAREFHRQGALLPSLADHASDDYLVALVLSRPDRAHSLLG